MGRDARAVWLWVSLCVFAGCFLVPVALSILPGLSGLHGTRMAGGGGVVPRSAQRDPGWATLDRLGHPPMHLAAGWCDAEVVEDCLKTGCDPDEPTGQGLTPLHYAAYCGQARTVHVLLHRGADVGATTSRGVTPLHSAAMGGHTDVIRVLLSHGADPNARKKGGRTPLHVAASMGHGECVRALVEAGADLYARDDAGATPLDVALVSKCPGAVEILRAYAPAAEAIAAGDDGEQSASRVGRRS